MTNECHRRVEWMTRQMRLHALRCRGPGRADLYTNLDITADHKWLAAHGDQLGFTAYPIAGPHSVCYGGGAQGWRVKIPSQHLTVIILTNLQGAQPEGFIAEVAALYAPKT